MKHSIFKCGLVVLALVCCVCSFAFAKGSSENKVNTGSESVDVDVDVKEAEDIKENASIKAFLKEVEDVEKKYEELVAKMELAYDKNDAVAYSEAKREVRSLEYPRLTEEKSREIETSLAENDYENANWLYQNSRYYHPVLKMVSTKDGFSYSSTMTANPGSDIVLPKIAGPSRALIFEGWGTSEDTVKYKAGETIKMPVKDITLYAVFSADPSIKEGKSLEISGIKISETGDFTVESGKIMRLVFDVKNTGTEVLRDVDIRFESDDPLFVILSEGLHCRYLPSADEGTARFKVITKASAGTKLLGKITVSAADGFVKTEDVTVTVK